MAEGKLDITDAFVEEMNFCLDCQACETACPAGVQYGSLVESARNQIRKAGKESVGARILKKIFLKNVISNKTYLRFIARILWTYQNSGIEYLLKKSQILRFITPRLAKIQDLAPRVDRHFYSDNRAEVISPSGEAKYRVGFLTGCLMDVSFAAVNDDTVKVLLHHGCEVVLPKSQVCCGSLQAHNGDFDVARDLAKINIDVFSRYNLDAIIMNSAGCGAMMKEYGHYMKDDPYYHSKAEILSSKIKDISEFLFDIGLRKPENEFPHRVSYHDACHLIHSQKVSMQPRALIKAIPGIEYVELNEASWCCGSAGIYNVVHYDDSMKILERKMRNIDITKAEFVVANNPGCLLQIDHGCRQYSLNTKIVHLATLLRMVYNL